MVRPFMSGTVQASSPTTWLTRSRTDHSVHGVGWSHVSASTAFRRSVQVSTVRRCSSSTSMSSPCSVASACVHGANGVAHPAGQNRERCIRERATPMPSPLRRWMFCSKPSAIRLANIELPPYDTSGRGTPVTGMMPRHIPMFWKA